MKKLVLGLALVASTSVFADVKAGKFGMGFAFSGNYGLLNTNQQAPLGTTMPSINALYHITDMIAVAANVGFYTTSYKDKSGLDSAGANGTLREYSRTAWGVGIEVPFYLMKFNLLNFYVAPGAGFTPTKTTTTTTNFVAGTSATAGSSPSIATNTYLSIYAAVGLQVAINDQLHAFGRTTIGYASGTYNTTNNSNTASPDSSDTYFGLQSWSVGALFYFN